MSEIACAWQRALASIASRQVGVRVTRYSDLPSFSSLWRGDERPRPPLQGAPDTAVELIVWDDTARNSERLLLPWLTPLDWALSRSIEALTAAESGDDLAVTILDLTFGAAFGTWSQRHAAALLDAMPWVSLHAPLSRRRRVQQRIPVDAWRNGRFVETTLQHVCRTTGGRHGRLAHLNALAQSWRGAIENIDAHHDLNNRIGAAVLLDQCRPNVAVAPEAAASLSLTGAFRRHVRRLSIGAAGRGPGHAALAPSQAPIASPAVPLNTSTSAAENQPNPPPEILPDIDLDVLLIDDEWQSGWGEITAHWLDCSMRADAITASASPPSPTGDWQPIAERPHPSATGPPTIRLFADDMPDRVIEVLTRQASWTSRDFERRFAPSADRTDSRTESPRSELILLDLYFRGDATAIGRGTYNASIRFLAAWALETLYAAPNVNWAWPPISRAELQALATEPSNDATGAVELDVAALTLLPRLLALAAPCTPIVVFSSSARAEIRTRLAPYRNVLTRFQKPRALEPDAVSVTNLRFRELLDAAHPWLLLQRQLTALQRARASLRARLPTLRPPAGEPASQAPLHVECFWDESGSDATNDLTQSCVAFVFRSEADAVALHEALLESTVTVPVSTTKSLEFCAHWITDAQQSKPTSTSTSPLPKFPVTVTGRVADLCRDYAITKLGLDGAKQDRSLFANMKSGADEVPLSALIGRASDYRAIAAALPQFAKWLTQTAAAGHTRSVRVRRGNAEVVLGRRDLSLLLLIEWLLTSLRAPSDRDRHGSPHVDWYNLPEGHDLAMQLPPWSQGVAALLTDIFGAVPPNPGRALEREYLARVRELSQGSPKATPAVLVFNSPVARISADVDPWPDAGLDSTTRHMAEAIVYDILPVLDLPARSTFRHFFATRHLGHAPLARRALRDHHSRWGSLPQYGDVGLVASANAAHHAWHMEGVRTAVHHIQLPPDLLSKVQVLLDLPPGQAWLRDSMNLPIRRFLRAGHMLDSASVQTYGSSSFVALARGVAADRATPAAPLLTGAVGVSLNFKSDLTSRERCFHEIVDWTSRFEKDGHSASTVLTEWHFNLDHADVATARVPALLAATRAAEAEQTADAIAAVLKLDWAAALRARQDECADIPTSMLGPLLLRATDGLATLSGDSIAALLGLPRQSRPMPILSSADRKHPVTRPHLTAIALEPSAHEPQEIGAVEPQHPAARANRPSEPVQGAGFNAPDASADAATVGTPGSEARRFSFLVSLGDNPPPGSGAALVAIALTRLTIAPHDSTIEMTKFNASVRFRFNPNRQTDQFRRALAADIARERCSAEDKEVESWAADVSVATPTDTAATMITTAPPSAAFWILVSPGTGATSPDAEIAGRAILTQLGLTVNGPSFDWTASGKPRVRFDPEAQNREFWHRLTNLVARSACDADPIASRKLPERPAHSDRTPPNNRRGPRSGRRH